MNGTELIADVSRRALEHLETAGEVKAAVLFVEVVLPGEEVSTSIEFAEVTGKAPPDVPATFSVVGPEGLSPYHAYGIVQIGAQQMLHLYGDPAPTEAE